MATYYFRNAGTNWNTAANWSLTDGGPANGAVPLAADTAYFTSNSGNCSTSANAVATNVVFSGVGAGNYSGTFTLNHNLTSTGGGGSITLSATMTTAGSGTLVVGSATTLTSNGCTWVPNLSIGIGTYTIADSWTINGNFISRDTNSGSTLALGTNNISVKGNLTLSQTTANLNQTGTGGIILNGTGTQTWSQPAYNGGALRTNLTISNANVVVSGSVGYGSQTLTATTSATTTGSTIFLNAACTLNTSNITWNNVTTTGAVTYTLSSALNVSGTLNIANSVTTFNGSTINFASLTMNTGTVQVNGSSNWVANATGTITMTGNSTLSITGNFTFNAGAGTVTIPTGSNLRFSGASSTGLPSNINILYTSGNIVFQQGSTFTVNAGAGSPTVTMPGVIFNNVIFGASSSPAIVLGSDIVCEGGTFQCGLSGTISLVINGVGRTVYIGNAQLSNFYTVAAGGTISGTANFVVSGAGNATWQHAGTPPKISNNITFNFNGTMTFYDFSTAAAGYALQLNAGTYTWISGKAVAYDSNNRRGRGGIFLNLTGATLIGFHKAVGFGYVTILGGATITMDQFFNGSPTCFLKVASSSATNYTITFQDRLERISNFVRVSNCTVTNRQQLLLLNSRGNGGNNIGVRYVNSLANSEPQKSTVANTYLTGAGEVAYLDGGLLTDPNSVYSF